MKNLRYLNIFTILIIYTLLMFYIGWNGWVWLHAVFGWESWGYYAFIVAFISYAYILVQVFKFLPFLRTIGSIWFAVIQYALMLLPLANIMVFLLQFSVEKEEAIIWTGAAVIAAFIFIFAYGVFNAYSPVVRKYEVHIPKKVEGRKSLRIA
ncbi:MAG TPA: phosphoesterase, partial [Bacillus sp. (in: Bacteria)]|nr:phosphoesterase [Bacillus sp. (in: firmicutes)]